MNASLDFARFLSSGSSVGDHGLFWVVLPWWFVFGVFCRGFYEGGGVLPGGVLSGGGFVRGVFSGGGLSGGFCPGGFCSGGFCPRGGFVHRGVLSRGVLSGEFCQGGFVQGGFVLESRNRQQYCYHDVTDNEVTFKVMHSYLRINTIECSKFIQITYSLQSDHFIIRNILHIKGKKEYKDFFKSSLRFQHVKL